MRFLGVFFKRPAERGVYLEEPRSRCAGPPHQALRCASLERGCPDKMYMCVCTCFSWPGVFLFSSIASDGATVHSEPQRNYFSNKKYWVAALFIFAGRII